MIEKRLRTTVTVSVFLKMKCFEISLKEVDPSKICDEVENRVGDNRFELKLSIKLFFNKCGKPPVFRTKYSCEKITNKVELKEQLHNTFSEIENDIEQLQSLTCSQTFYFIIVNVCFNEDF